MPCRRTTAALSTKNHAVASLVRVHFGRLLPTLSVQPGEMLLPRYRPVHTPHRQPANTALQASPKTQQKWTATLSASRAFSAPAGFSQRYREQVKTHRVTAHSVQRTYPCHNKSKSVSCLRKKKKKDYKKDAATPAKRLSCLGGHYPSAQTTLHTPAEPAFIILVSVTPAHSFPVHPPPTHKNPHNQIQTFQKYNLHVQMSKHVGRGPGARVGRANQGHQVITITARQPAVRTWQNSFFSGLHSSHAGFPCTLPAGQFAIAAS